jgi:hypothetical protein
VEYEFPELRLYGFSEVRGPDSSRIHYCWLTSIGQNTAQQVGELNNCPLGKEVVEESWGFVKEGGPYRLHRVSSFWPTVGKADEDKGQTVLRGRLEMQKVKIMLASPGKMRVRLLQARHRADSVGKVGSVDG